MFDIGEICDLLRVENMCDVCAIAVPAHLNYVEHLVVATGASRRHLRAVASQVKKIVRLSSLFNYAIVHSIIFLLML